MADDPQNPDPNAAPPVEPASPPAAAPPSLTTEQVQAMIDAATKKAYDAGAAAGRKATEAKLQHKQAPATKPTEANPEQPANTVTAVDVDALSDALAEFTFDKEQRRTIRDLARRENPADVDEFVSKWARMFGAKSATAPSGQPAPTSNNAAPTQQQPQNPPQQQGKVPAVPASAPTADREFDPIFRAMTEDAARDTWQAYVRRKGANPANPYDPRNRAAWRELRKQFEAQAATAGVQLGARRG